MGGCCSASGTASGTAAPPGAPSARDKTKPAATPTKTPPPAKTAPHDNTKAAPTAPPPPPPAPAPEPRQVADARADSLEVKAPQAAPAAAHSGPPPPAQPDHSRPPPAPHHAELEAPQEDEFLSQEGDTGHPGGSPNSTAETRAFVTAGEAEASHPPPEAAPPASSAEAEAEPEVPAEPPRAEAVTTAEKAALVFTEAPPALQSATPVNITPERLSAPHFSPREEADEGTRGPSTARVEEVPPTPVRDVEGNAVQSLSADDARVLMRVPPPPPPPLFTPTETPHNAEDQEEEGEGEEEEEGEEAAVPPPAQARSDDAMADNPTPLVDGLHSQSHQHHEEKEEEKQRYPTALTTDAKDDAPLELTVEEAHSSSTKEQTEGAARHVDPAVPAKAELSQEAQLYTDAAHNAVSLPSASPAAEDQDEKDDADDDAVSSDAAAPTRGAVFKILLRAEWDELRTDKVFRGNPADLADHCIKLATAEQAREAVRAFPGDATPLVLIACSLESLARPGETEAALRWAVSPHTGQRAPRLYRPLRLDTDVLWFKECANAAEVAERLEREVVLSDSSSDADEEVQEQPEKAAEAAGEGEQAAKGPANAAAAPAPEQPPISFTDTSDIERELAAEDDEDDHHDTPRLTPPVEDAPPAPAAAAQDGGEDEEDDRPHPIVKTVVPAVALAAPVVEHHEADDPPTQHTAAAMASQEAAPMVPHQPPGHHSDAAAPRRVPPPLPSPPGELTEAVHKEPTTPPPSRPAPPSILSPAPM